MMSIQSLGLLLIGLPFGERWEVWVSRREQECDPAVLVIFKFFAPSIARGEAPRFLASPTNSKEEKKLSLMDSLLLLLRGENSLWKLKKIIFIRHLPNTIKKLKQTRLLFERTGTFYYALLMLVTSIRVAHSHTPKYMTANIVCYPFQ